MPGYPQAPLWRRLGGNAAHGYGDRLAAQLSHVSAWAGRTSSGDIGELGLPDESLLYPFITSTSDNCLGQGCPEVQACHVVRARREAQAAEVVVVNHHLLLADLTLREEGFAELLPGADAVIVDEAHQRPAVRSSRSQCHTDRAQRIWNSRLPPGEVAVTRLRVWVWWCDGTPGDVRNPS